MKSRFVLLIVVISVSFASTGHALAPYKKVFDAKYVKPTGDAEFRAAFKKASCNTCHVKGKKKDVVNDFGLQLAELIEGNGKDRLAEARKGGADAKKAEQQKLIKELEEALTQVETAEAPGGGTYGELLKSHKLPGPEGAKSVRK